MTPIAPDNPGDHGVDSGSGGGGLTDAELRASPVDVSVVGEVEIKNDSGNPIPVSGTVTVSDGSGPLTVDGTINVGNFPATQNVAVVSSVEVEVKNDTGSAIPVTGPLTDAQLRATAVPVSGTVTITDGSGPVTVDGTVTANIGTTNGLALDATLTGGSQKAILRGNTKGATAAADATVRSVDADHNALDVYVAGSSASVGTTISTIQTTIGTGAAIQIQSSSTPATQGVVVKAPGSNAGILYVGASGVTTSTGYPLEAGETVSIPVDNANKVYATSDTAAQTAVLMVV